MSRPAHCGIGPVQVVLLGRKWLLCLCVPLHVSGTQADFAQADFAAYWFPRAWWGRCALWDRRPGFAVP